MRLVKFELAYAERNVHINPEYVESVTSAYDYESSGKEIIYNDHCVVLIVGSESSYRVKGSLEEVIAKLHFL